MKICKLLGHPRYLLLPSPSIVQCGSCLKFMKIKEPVSKELYKKGYIKNEGKYKLEEW